MLHYPFSLETPNCSVRDFLGVACSPLHLTFLRAGDLIGGELFVAEPEFEDFKDDGVPDISDAVVLKEDLGSATLPLVLLSCGAWAAVAGEGAFTAVGGVAKAPVALK